jgi:hypothetical protein
MTVYSILKLAELPEYSSCKYYQHFKFSPGSMVSLSFPVKTRTRKEETFLHNPVQLVPRLFVKNVKISTYLKSLCASFLVSSLEDFI